MKKGDYERLLAVGPMFHNSELDITVALHGDDFVAEGCDDELDKLDALLVGHMKVKVLPRIGPGHAEAGPLLKRM
eukprot:1674334-Alexandrium_andersonii.AAC.1